MRLFPIGIFETFDNLTKLSMSHALHHRPPFRAEHLGSLLRPKELLDERHAADEGKGDQKKLTSVEDTSVKDIVKEQLDLGFRAVTDGEYRRHMFWYVQISFPR